LSKCSPSHYIPSSTPSPEIALLDSICQSQSVIWSSSNSQHTSTSVIEWGRSRLFA